MKRKKKRKEITPFRKFRRILERNLFVPPFDLTFLIFNLDARSKGKSVSIRGCIYTPLSPLRSTLIDTVSVRLCTYFLESRPRGICVDLAPSHAGRPQIKLATRAGASCSRPSALTRFFP